MTQIVLLLSSRCVSPIWNWLALSKLYDVLYNVSKLLKLFWFIEKKNLLSLGILTVTVVEAAQTNMRVVLKSQKCEALLVNVTIGTGTQTKMNITHVILIISLNILLNQQAAKKITSLANTDSFVALSDHILGTSITAARVCVTSPKKDSQMRICSSSLLNLLFSFSELSPSNRLILPKCHCTSQTVLEVKRRHYGNPWWAEWDYIS